MFRLSCTQAERLVLLLGYNNGDAIVEPTGAVMTVEGERYTLADISAEHGGNPALAMPAGLPVGVHLLEVHSVGARLLYEHVEVQPSPCVGEVFDRIAEVLVPTDRLQPVIVQIHEGPAGPAGKSAWELIQESGFAGTFEEWLNSVGVTDAQMIQAVAPALLERQVRENPPISGYAYSATTNYLTLPGMRYGATSTPYTYYKIALSLRGVNTVLRPLYLEVWNHSRMIARSINALVISPLSAPMYEWTLPWGELATENDYYLLLSDGASPTSYNTSIHSFVAYGYDATDMLEFKRSITGLPTFSNAEHKTLYAECRLTALAGGQYNMLTGPAGPKGDPGVSPTPEDVAAALVPMISAEFSYEGPAAANNWHASYFMLGENYMPEGTALTEFGYRVRFDSIAGCTTDPVYLGIWEREENSEDWVLRGVSLNTQTQAQSSDVIWQFQPDKVRLHGRPIRVCLMANPDDGWRTDLTMGLRVSDVTAANTAIYLNEQSWQKAPKFFLRGYKPVDSIHFGSGSGGGGGAITVDHSYDPNSENPASGKAIADALKTIGSGSANKGVDGTDFDNPVRMLMNGSTYLDLSRGGVLSCGGEGVNYDSIHLNALFKAVRYVEGFGSDSNSTTGGGKNKGEDGTDFDNPTTTLTHGTAYLHLGAYGSLSAQAEGNHYTITIAELFEGAKYAMQLKCNSVSGSTGGGNTRPSGSDFEHLGSGAYSTVVGSFADAGENGVAVGDRAKATGLNAIAIGCGAKAADGGVSIGKNASASFNEVEISVPLQKNETSTLSDRYYKFRFIAPNTACDSAMAPSFSYGKGDQHKYIPLDTLHELVRDADALLQILAAGGVVSKEVLRYENGSGYIGGGHDPYNIKSVQQGEFTIRTYNASKNCAADITICACGSYSSTYFLDGKAGIVCHDYPNQTSGTPGHGMAEYYMTFEDLFKLAQNADKLLKLINIDN